MENTNLIYKKERKNSEQRAEEVNEKGRDTSKSTCN